MASVADITGVLVAEVLADETENQATYSLYLRPSGATQLVRASEPGGTSDIRVLDGFLGSTGHSFFAILLSLRIVDGDRWAGLRFAEWSTEGGLLRSADVVALPFLAEPDCMTPTGTPCSVRASFRLEPGSVLVTIVDRREIHRTRIDIASAEPTAMPSVPLVDERRPGEPISEFTDETGLFLAAVGGAAPRAPPRPAVLIAHDDSHVGEAEPLAGLPSDPPAVLAGTADGISVWRFVTDASRSIDSAIRGFRVSDGTIGEVQWTIPTAMGFSPAAMAVLADVETTVLWAAMDPADFEVANLHIARLSVRTEECIRIDATIAARIPWPLRQVAARPMAVERHDDALLVAVLGERGDESPLVLLRLPRCE